MARGKLKIFFGYCAGVGKTYAMLAAARKLKESGTDVVLGYLEPHARPKTLEQAEGFERLPLKIIDYKGIMLKEFDVDAAVARRPQLILVDELAHTNAAGSKNDKRWLDVEELLINGIDVWTTLNVQHIEGLRDLVDYAAGVDVTERVPDEIFDYADEAVIVDIEPELLIERLRAGEIYGKSGAAAALNNFFKADNLLFLRELLMRRGADRIEKQANNGKLKTRVLALISPSPSSEKNIHVAARTARAYHCNFTAMYVERDGALSDEAAHNLKRHVKLVSELGGDTIVKYGEDVVETVADYVRVAGVTNLIIGKTWRSAGKKAGLEDKFVARLPHLQILIVPDNERVSYRPPRFNRLLSGLFTPSRLLKKYRTANRILDIHTVIEREMADTSNAEFTVASALSRAFSRSCAVFGKKTAVCRAQEEDISFLYGVNERAVADWARTNGKPAGRGTDTLRGAQAIYLPAGEGVVIAFSCRAGKLTVTDRLIFAQLLPLLKLILGRSDRG